MSKAHGVFHFSRVLFHIHLKSNVHFGLFQGWSIIRGHLHIKVLKVQFQKQLFLILKENYIT